MLALFIHIYDYFGIKHMLQLHLRGVTCAGVPEREARIDSRSSPRPTRPISICIVVYTYMYMYIDICMYVYTYIYIYIHTYIDR